MRISLWQMLLFKLQFYQLGWFWAFGVEDTHMEGDELKVYSKWTLHCIDLLYTATHWTVTVVVQWHAHSPEVSMNNRTAKVVVFYLFDHLYWNLIREVSRSDKEFKIAITFRRYVPEKIACSGLLLFERLEQATEKKGMDLWKRMSSKWSFTFFCGIFWLKPVPFRDCSLCWVCILHQACVLLSVCSLHFTFSLHFTPGPQCAFYTDRKLRTCHKMCVATFTVLTLC